MTAEAGGAEGDRVCIAQATGMLMQQHGTDEQTAFALLRQAAEETGLLPVDAARELVENWARGC